MNLCAKCSVAAFVMAVAGSACADVWVPAQFPTIQAALDASPAHETIRVAPGVYTEQLVIVRDVEIYGEAGTVLRAPAAMAQNLLPASDRRALISVKDGAFAGIFEMVLDGNSSGAQNAGLTGVAFVNASGQLWGNFINNFRAAGVPADEAHEGIAVWAWSPDADGPVRTAWIGFNETNNNNHGIVLQGDAGEPDELALSAYVTTNRIFGLGPTPYSQFGVRVGAGVLTEMRRNLIAHHEAEGGRADTVGAGIWIADKTAAAMQMQTVFNNTLRFNQVGIAASDVDGALIRGNHVRASRDVNNTVGLLISGDTVQVVANRVDNADLGVVLSGGGLFGVANNVWVISNEFNHNGAAITQQAGATNNRIRNNDVD